MDELTMARELAAPMAYGWVPMGHPKPNPNGGGHVCEGAPYITADEARHRLNRVFGPLGWWPTFETLYEYCDTSGKFPQYICAMNCTIQVRDTTDEHMTRTVIKTDTGNGSARTAEDARKAAYSDSLKRAASMYGVGYFLEHIPKRWMPCVTSKSKDGKFDNFAAWAEVGGEVLPEIARRLDLMIDDYSELGITVEQLEGWVGPCDKWTADTLYSFQVHHARLMAEKPAQPKQANPREEAGDSRSPDAPASSSSTDDKFDPFDPKQPEWLLEYPLLRGETQAMVRAWEKAGMDWRDIEIESGKKLIHLSSDEVRKFFASIRRQHATKG